MTVPEAARYLGRSPAFVRARIAAGDIPLVPGAPGKRRYLNREDVDRWRLGGAVETAPPKLYVMPRRVRA
jgi:excisionase family DNA binding protein